jgi:hypothetical protein
MANANGLRIGSQITLPCTVTTGFFPDEMLVRISVESSHKPIVGYMDSKSIIHKNGSRFVLGLVMDSSDNSHARVFLPGDIVSGTNPVTVPLDWLNRYA